LHVFLYNAQQSLIFQAKAKFLKKRRRKGAQVCRKINKNLPGISRMWAFVSVGQWAVAIAVAREKTCTSRAVGSCYWWSKGPKTCTDGQWAVAICGVREKKHAAAGQRAVGT
jgi:hypothetical protein